MSNEIHKYNTRDNNNLHLPIASLSKFNEGAYFSGIKVFNHLPEYIKNLSNRKCLTSSLKSFFISTFLSLIKEYFKYKESRKI
jgi:hypothetical protein